MNPTRFTSIRPGSCVNVFWSRTKREAGFYRVALIQLVLTFCFGGHNLRSSGALLLAVLLLRRRRLLLRRRHRLLHLLRCGSPGVCRTGPSEPGAPVRPGARRPWRPSRPRRRVCRGNARRRSRGSPSCIDPGGCTRPRPGRTSRTPAGGFQGRSGTSGCPL